jgi:hypothetical protein
MDKLLVLTMLATTLAVILPTLIHSLSKSVNQRQVGLPACISWAANFRVDWFLNSINDDRDGKNFARGNDAVNRGRVDNWDIEHKSLRIRYSEHTQCHE